MDSSVDRPTRYHFFLNPFERMALTRCPLCDAKTRVRKLPLAIHIEPHTFCILNKTCKLCLGCELLIARHSEIEPLLASMLARDAVEPDDYLVIGTIDRNDWRESLNREWKPRAAMDRVYPFKSNQDFKITGGWVRTDDADR